MKELKTTLRLSLRSWTPPLGLPLTHQVCYAQYGSGVHGVFGGALGYVSEEGIS